MNFPYYAHISQLGIDTNSIIYLIVYRIDEIILRSSAWEPFSLDNPILIMLFNLHFATSKLVRVQVSGLRHDAILPILIEWIFIDHVVNVCTISVHLAFYLNLF